MTIPSGDIEQPTENSDADDAVEYALARRHAEPLARHTSHDGGGHCGHEANVPQTTITAYHGLLGPRTNQNTVRYMAKNSNTSRYQTL